MTRPLMIFCAGFGRRMLHLTADRPKPMVEVGGRTMIDRAIDLGREAGADPIVANTHYLPEVITPRLIARGIRVAHEPGEILDTGGGLAAARPLLGPGPCWTLNPDAIFAGPNPLEVLQHSWREGMRALLLCVPLERAQGRKGGGDFTLSGDRLRFGGDHVYTGAQIIDPSVLEGVSERAYSLRNVWQTLADEDALHGVVYPGSWADVGHPDGIALAESLLADV